MLKRATEYLCSFAILSRLFTLTYELSTGAPLDPIVCSTLEPIGHISYAALLEDNTSQAPDFRIETSVGKSWFKPEEILNISLHSPRNLTFRGLVMQVQDEYGSASGRFIDLDPSYKMYNCHEMFLNAAVNSTITHAEKSDKLTGQFRWEAPENCSGITYHIRATLVLELALYQTGLTATINCFADGLEITHDPTSEISDSKPTHEAMTCQYLNETSLPTGKYQTSFEDGEIHGWNIKNWTINSNETLSVETGPLSAAQGSNYLYFETSFPVKPMSTAVVESDADLKGCFCLKLSHCHNVDPRRHHKLTIMAGEVTLFETEQKSKEWQDLALQVDTNEFVKIKIIGSRGENFKGDMAIDNIRLTEGWCT